MSHPLDRIHIVRLQDIPEVNPMDSNVIETGYLLNVKTTLKKMEAKEVNMFDINRMIQDGFFG